MQQWERIQILLQVKVVIDHLKVIEQVTLIQRERDVWRESFERANEQAASRLPLDLLEGGAGKIRKQVGGTGHAPQ